MPVMDGIAATEKIKAELPEVEVVALTSVLDDGAVTGAARIRDGVQTGPGARGHTGSARRFFVGWSPLGPSQHRQTCSRESDVTEAGVWRGLDLAGG